MSQVIPIPARTLQDGSNPLPDANVPAGCTGATLSIDGTNFLPGMIVRVIADIVDGSGAGLYHFDNSVTGLGMNKATGLPNTKIEMTFGWSNPAPSGWKVRSSYELTNGPLAISSGSLTLLP